MVKALTLWQPWASLVALGVKTIETRSWSTTYRGPVLIHAAAKRPPSWVRPVGDYKLRPFGRTGWAMEGPGLPAYRSTPRLEGYMVPWGSVLAVAELTDVVPMRGYESEPDPDQGEHLWAEPDGLKLWQHDPEGWGGWSCTEVEDQRPYGDFAPGRWAWLLADIRPVDLVAAKGRQGLWNPPPELVAQVLASVT